MRANVFALHDTIFYDGNLLYVCFKRSFGSTHAMADVVAGYFAFSANAANLRHIDTSVKLMLKYYSIIQRKKQRF